MSTNSCAPLGAAAGPGNAGRGSTLTVTPLAANASTPTRPASRMYVSLLADPAGDGRELSSAELPRDARECADRVSAAEPDEDPLVGDGGGEQQPAPVG